MIRSTDELDEIATRSSEEREGCDCLDQEHYIPNEKLTVIQDVKYIRTLINFMNNKAGTQNYVGKDAATYAKSLIKHGNAKMDENPKMNLPKGNSTAVETIPWRYVLGTDPNTETGLAVYEEYDDELFWMVSKGKGRNNGDMEVIKKYKKDEGRSYNVFAMPHHPDSLESPTFKALNVGISLGPYMKICGIGHRPVNKAWEQATNFNHEMGHSLGLRHSWHRSDGCDDTPSHPNCYQEGSGRCKGPISNNMMDYNNDQRALTPCQIAIATKNLHNERSRIRPLVIKDWCDLDSTKNLVVTDSIHLDRHADLKGDIIVSNGGYLKLSCKVHLPKMARIIVEPDGTLELNACTLYNDCGSYWDGIDLLSKGEKKATLIKKGNVQLLNIN